MQYFELWIRPAWQELQCIMFSLKFVLQNVFFYHSASILTFIQVSHFTYFYVFCFCFTCLFLDHGYCIKAMHSCIITIAIGIFPCCNVCLYLYFITSRYSPPLTSGFQDNYIHCFKQCKGFSKLFFVYQLYFKVFK